MEELDKTKHKGKKTRNSGKIDRRVKKTLNAIHSTAIQLFNIKNFNEITMEEIAEQADISRATLYTHFKSKEEIYFKIGYERFLTFNESMKPLIKAPMTGFDTNIMLCTTLLERMVTDATASRVVYILLRNEKLALVESILDKKIEKEVVKKHLASPEIRAMMDFLGQLRVFEESWSAIIQKGIDDHSITTELEPIQLTHYLIIILNGIVDQMVARDYVLKKIKLDQHIILDRTLQTIKQILKS